MLLTDVGVTCNMILWLSSARKCFTQLGPAPEYIQNIAFQASLVMLAARQPFGLHLVANVLCTSAAGSKGEVPW